MKQAIQAFHLGFMDAVAWRNLRYFLIAAVVVVLVFSVIYLVLDELVAGWLSSLHSTGWVYWVVNALFHAIAGFLGYLLIAPLVLVVVSLFTEQIVDNIRHAHYPQRPVLRDGMTMVAMMTEMGMASFKYLLGMLLASPLLFTGVGHFILLILGYLLFRKLLLVEVLGIWMDQKKVREHSTMREVGSHKFSTLLLYLMSMVPFANLFIPYMAVCVVTHESMLSESGVTVDV